MNTLQWIEYCKIFSTLSFLGVVYLYIKCVQDKKIKSKYQKEIDLYFENMRWYGFKDNEIANMLHEIKSHKELKETNSKAYKERKGKI